MSNWTKSTSEERQMSKDIEQNWAPKKIIDKDDLRNEIQNIEMNNGMNMLDKMKAKRQLFKTVAEAKQMELHHNMESYRNYLLARKDVEAKAIAQEATKAITIIEGQFYTMMSEIGIAQKEKLMDTLIKAGEMYTRKLGELDKSPMLPKLKVQMADQFEGIYQNTTQRIMGSMEEYMEELNRRDGRSIN